MSSSVNSLEFSLQSIIEKIDNIRSNETLTDTEKSENFKATDEFLKKFLKTNRCEHCDSFFVSTCDFCMRKCLKEKDWDTENSEINEWIRSYQGKINRPDNILEWIPYSDLQNVQFVPEGGFHFKIKAIWAEGRYANWDAKQRTFKRLGAQSVTVKYITMSNLDQEQWKDQWLQEINVHLLLSSINSPVLRTFGITKDDGNNYMAVTENVTHDLKKFLQVKAYSLNWMEKCKILLQIIDSLESVHKNQLIHGDLHPGTIWFSTSREIWLIGDFRFCRPVDSPISESFGTMPYVSPEMLREPKGPMTLSSDIYSFAMIMWEVATGRRPFYDKLHSPRLSEEIVNNDVRPSILDGIPKRYSEIMKKCWDKEPSNRLEVVDVQNKIRSLIDDYKNDILSKEEQTEMRSVFGSKNIPLDGENVNDGEHEVKPNEGPFTIKIFEQHNISDERRLDGSKISFATVSSEQVVIKTLQINKNDKINMSIISRLPKSFQQRVAEFGSVYQHPNIVEFVGVGIRDENKLFLVMQVASGGNLRDYLRAKTKLSFDKKIKIAKSITSGIMKLHEMEIVHENINPKNILMFDGIPRISNLPLPFKEPYEIKAFKNRDLYATFDLFDSIGYVDPNWFKSNGKSYVQEKPVDIYSLGTLLWEIMSEKVPFQDTLFDKNGGILGLIRKIRAGTREKDDIPGITKFPDKYIDLYKQCWNEISEDRPKISDVYEQLTNMN